MNKLTNIICASLISFSCANDVSKGDFESMIKEAPNESLVHLNSNGEYFSVYKNSKGKCEYLQKVNTSGNIEFYKFYLDNNRIVKEVTPRFILIDTDNDGIKDIGLRYISKTNYDTLKPSQIYLLYLN